MTIVAGTKARRARWIGAWLATHIVDIVFVLMVLAAFVYAMHLTSGAFFIFDDWRLLVQGSSVGGFFKPYNNHLSIIIIGTYRLLAAIFGLKTYAPTRVIGLGALYAVPLAYFFTTRRLFGPVLAALLALPLVWYGKDLDLFAGAFNHYLALLGGVVCAAALNRGRRADGVLAAGLMFALCSAGGGVAVAAACVVHNLCSRAAVRRWLAVLVPSLLWFLWWAIWERELTASGPYTLSTARTLSFIRRLGFTPFDSVALDVGILAAIACIAYVAWGIWVLSRGIRNGANFVAWSIALVVWGYGVASSRTLLASTDVFRYRYVALGFALLAIVPRSPIRWSQHVPIVTDRRWLAGGAVVVVLLGGARAFAVRDDMQSSGRRLSGFGRVARENALVLGLGPTAVADGTQLPFLMGNLRAEEMRTLFARYGQVAPTSLATIDEEFVAMKAVTTYARTAPKGHCSSILSSAKTLTVNDQQVLLRAPDGAVTVEVRRFGDRWVTLGQVHPGTVLHVQLTDFSSPRPWELRAPGACDAGRTPLVGPRPPVSS